MAQCGNKTNVGLTDAINSSVGNIIDSTFNQLLKYDSDDVEFVVNPQNIDISLSLIKSFYKTKIITIIGNEPNPKKKIMTLNVKILEINEKINRIKIDPIAKNIVYGDIVTYVSEQMSKINTQILKKIVPETSLTEINMYYDETCLVEKNLMLMCSKIKTSFALEYENIIICKIKENFVEIDKSIDKICEGERYELTEEILSSYTFFCKILEAMVIQYNKISSQNVKMLLVSKVISSHNMYLKVCMIDTKDNNVNMLILSTIAKIKKLIFKDEFIGSFGNKNDISSLYSKCDSIENVIKNKIISQHIKPISEILKSCSSKYSDEISRQDILSYAECPKKINGVLSKIIFSDKINEQIVMTIWNDFINALIINLIQSFIDCGNIFSTDFISIAEVVSGDIIEIITKLIPKIDERDLIIYRTSIFSKIKTFIKFIKLCVSENDIKKNDKKESIQQFQKDFENLKDDFTLLNIDFEEYCSGITLFDYLKQMREKDALKLRNTKHTRNGSRDGQTLRRGLANVMKKK